MNKKYIFYYILLIASIFFLNNISTISAACTDSDEGKVYETKGTLTIGTKSYTDYCSTTNSKYLAREYYCKNNERAAQKVNILCKGGCVNGACQDDSINSSGNSSCTPNWQLDPWSACINGQQTRAFRDANNCGILTNKPQNQIQNCEVQKNCTPNWQCGSWGDCLNGQQVRKCIDFMSCNSLNNKLALTRSCHLCTPNWQETAWSECFNGQQTRTFIDSNNCGKESNKPIDQSQSCVASQCGDGKIQADEQCDDGYRQDGDGCSMNCLIETQYTCQGQPSKCSILCGNGMIDSGEQCDQDFYNGSAYNICSADCKLLAVCGDGVCNTNFEAYNTCSKDCAQTSCLNEGETGKIIVENFKTVYLGTCCFSLARQNMYDNSYTFKCSKAGNGICDPGETYLTSAKDCKCGNAVVDYGEKCDLGFNKNIPAYGCSIDCKTIEAGWDCGNYSGRFECKHLCGNGIVNNILSGLSYRYTEECDDKNLNNNDGCSSVCKQESGYKCDEFNYVPKQGPGPSICKKWPECITHNDCRDINNSCYYMCDVGNCVFMNNRPDLGIYPNCQ